MGDGNEAGNWCLIESDPGVFTEMVQKLGVKGVQFEEVYSLSKDLLAPLNPVYGLIFLFKWVKDDKPQGTVVKDSRADEIFFPKQVVNNACATQAIISCLLNLNKEKNEGVELGETLEQFKAFTGSFDPGMKGLSLGSSLEIRTVHNSFARQSVFELDQKVADKDDDVFHFVTYVPIGGRIYELDGLKEGPVDHGKVPEGTDWLDGVIPILMERMAKYQAGEIQFNLMAVIQDKITTFSKQLEAVQAAGGDPDTIADIRMRIAGEEENRRRWRQENVRRRHNYLPFIVELLKFLAAENQLTSVYEKAKEKSIALQKKKEERKAAMAASGTPLK